MTASAGKKYFTVAEANAMLPLVRAIVDDIVQLKNEIEERSERLKGVRRLPGKRRDEDNPYDEEVQQIEEDIEKDHDRLEEFCDELRRLGVELKDPKIGLIDFLTQIDGREAYLCWKLGEGEIAFWHELEAGFAGRQSLLEGSSHGGKPGEAGEK
ncbi:MAG TPA: DUF2203 domain-containing protein [Planctomycetaceae bacterium]|nr:DUF2203 domain-containing protein [Planctomycetaceae bacterium]